MKTKRITQQDKLYAVLKAKGFKRIISAKYFDIPNDTIFMRRNSERVTIGPKGFLKSGPSFSKLTPAKQYEKEALLDDWRVNKYLTKKKMDQCIHDAFTFGTGVIHINKDDFK